MISLIQKISAAIDRQGVTSAEDDFDRLLERVEADETELALLENRVRDEFETLEGDVKRVSKGVDQAVQ